jgi:hypothetical protein
MLIILSQQNTKKKQCLSNQIDQVCFFQNRKSAHRHPDHAPPASRSIFFQTEKSKLVEVRV